MSQNIVVPSILVPTTSTTTTTTVSNNSSSMESPSSANQFATSGRLLPLVPACSNNPTRCECPSFAATNSDPSVRYACVQGQCVAVPVTSNLLHYPTPQACCYNCCTHGACGGHRGGGGTTPPTTTTRYTCDNATGQCVLDTNGAYSSLSSCQSSCTPINIGHPECLTQFNTTTDQAIQRYRSCLRAIPSTADATTASSSATQCSNNLIRELRSAHTQLDACYRNPPHTQ